jgi:dihydrofolate reductase
MRKVVLYELMSVDGVAEDPDDWLFDVDEELIDNLANVIELQDDVLLGRRTYDEWADYWPTSDFELFAGFINNTPKHVFTSTPPTSTWQNSVFPEAPAIDYVEKLRRQEGRDIGVHASLTLAQSLVAAGLVDELRLVVAPTIAQEGRKLFEGYSDQHRLELLEADRTSGGNLLLHYRLGTGAAG